MGAGGCDRIPGGSVSVRRLSAGTYPYLGTHIHTYTAAADTGTDAAARTAG